ncbi:MAG TPA: DUF5695 domain-containing protein [Candidatus Polarisedimenticolia bacterium]|nr:DUF5695 domain-containing protein [Candidatus Polarisedimenticolia bacterium]
MSRWPILFCVLVMFQRDAAFGQTSQVVPEQSGPVQSPQVHTNAPQAPQTRRRRGFRAAGPPTLGLEQGTNEFDTPDFTLKLLKASQTVAALEPKGGDGFDFTPADQLGVRTGDRFYQLGDLTLRVREGTNGDWQNISTAAARKPVTALSVSGSTLAAADLAPTLPEDCPLQITRSWVVDNGKLVLKFDLKNKSSSPVEIGALGIPLIFNNLITDFTRNRPRSLDQAHRICSFTDPAICMDAGYVQVTRLNGHGPALVVVEDGKTPLEAFNPLHDDLTPRSQTFEGFYEWTVHSLAFAENEWKNAQPWDAPTAETIAPGATRTFGLKFLAAPEIQDIEKTLAANNRPVAVGVPGYIVPMDLDARLFLNYGARVKSVDVAPEGAISVSKDTPTKDGWKAYTLRGKKWGRSRLTITYDDGLVQTISYDVIKPEVETVADLGNFLFTKQWFTDTNDPFHRAPSVMTYDRGHDRIVTQDSRAWIAGLEDEGGAGSWVAAAMKEFGEPNPDEVAKFEQFVDGVLWGGIQYKDGPLKYGVRKSMFYYDTNAFPNYYDSNIRYGGWTSWSKRDAERIDRAYNYPHVAAAYWSMYRLARNHPGMVTNHPWDWYLEQAYQTTKFLFKRDSNDRSMVGYIDTGLMEGDIFVLILKDLKREGWTDKASEVERDMKERAEVWKSRAYPFGSEMAWDSTGQEEVYAWTKYFGYDDKSEVSLDSILGYMPLVPNWGYNGDARRYWDFYYGAAPGGQLERQIHHYGSGINSIPVLAAYRERPDDFYLLRLGYAGTMAPLSNIDPDGFAAAAFHSSPSLMRWDTYSGDYGPNFFGHALNTATYIIDHPEFGWLAFGGNAKSSGNKVTVQPLDSFRRRIYIAPVGLWLTLDAGKFEGVEYNAKTHAVRLELSPQTRFTPQARLRIEQPAKISGIGTYHPRETFVNERDAFTIPLKAKSTWVELSETH